MLKKMKIAFIIPTLGTGGAERVVSILANRFILNYDVFIITFFEGRPFYPINEKVQLLYCQKEPFKKSGVLKSFSNHRRLYSNLKSNLKKNNIDLVIGFMTTANIHSVLVAKSLNIPSIISERVHPEYSAVNALWFQLRRFIYPKANKLVIQTKEIRDYFLNYLSKSNLEIINNPIATELIDMKDDSVPKQNLILSVGRLDNQKNQELIIRAFAKIDFKNWKLLILGEGINRKAYESLIIDLLISDHVEILGNISSVSSYYNKAKIFVLSSNYEGSPNALIEAMCFGLACISTNCPTGPSELITHGENGFLIPIKDQTALESKLNILINDPEKIKSFGIEASKISKRFSLNNVELKWLKLIDDLLVS